MWTNRYASSAYSKLGHKKRSNLWFHYLALLMPLGNVNAYNDKKQIENIGNLHELRFGFLSTGEFKKLMNRIGLQICSRYLIIKAMCSLDS